MKAIILAGGQGNRLHPLTLEVPKPLITVHKKPIINYTLGLLAEHDVRDVKILIRPSDEKDYERWQREYSGDFPDMKIELVQEPMPMGTFGYIFHELQGWIEHDDVFVTNGDDIKDIDLKKMIIAHRMTGASATLALMKMEQPDDYGAVLVRENKITDFLEKKQGLPPSFVSAGMYVISSTAFDHVAVNIPKEKKYLMLEQDLFPALAKHDKLGAFFAEGRFFDCGTFERWEQAILEVPAPKSD